MDNYYTDTIDFSVRKLVNGNAENQIKDYLLQLDLFQQEINFWFLILNRTQNVKERNYLRKPICIELFEYCGYLQSLKKLIKKSSNRINIILSEAKGNYKPVSILDRSIDEILKQSINYLQNPRNQFAAHRYTKKTKEFLTINEIINLTPIKHDFIMQHI